MTLPIDLNSTSYRFYKTLNEDVKLTSNEYGEWDIVFEKDDWVNLTGFESLANACVISIMTRFNELNYTSLYEDFGCRIHEITKKNKGRNAKYHIELFVTDVLMSMRRISKVNYVDVIDETNTNSYYNYTVKFSIISITDDNEDGEIIEESFTV